MPIDEQHIATLRREGRYAEAAAICEAHGDSKRAAELYAAVWEFDRAVAICEAAGLLEEAYVHATQSPRAELAQRVVERLLSAPPQALRAAAHADGRARLAEAARLYEAGGDLDAAAERFERAGELFEAGRCHELAGRQRDAGRLYERRLKEAPEDSESALRLGRLLAQLGRYEHAVRALQLAMKDGAKRGGALRIAVACFAAAGMQDAAARCLDELVRDDPALPITVREFLRESFGDERGLKIADRDALIGGRYRVVKPLGAGASGRVVLAHDAFYEKPVAIKVLSASGGAAGRDAHVRFAKEARIAQGIEHPNVVRAIEWNPDGPFLVMEYMSGGTLEDRLGKIEGKAPLALGATTTRHVASSILRALSFVHTRGVVHRDLKPANVFFGPTGEVKVGDFGVAHLAELGVTMTGAMLGTLAYMSPEQITGSATPDASTDLYALGVIVYRLLTGVLPFEGPDFVAQHLTVTPSAPSAHAAPLARFDALIAAMLAKDPKERPRSAEDVLAAIGSIPFERLENELAPATQQRISDRPKPGSEVDPASTPPPSARFVPTGETASGAAIARDEVLLRRVRIEPCDELRRARLRALARADSPFLQAVLDLDDTQAVLEHPTGRPLRSLLEEGVAIDRARIAREIAAAVAKLRATHLVHGAVDADHVVVGEGRAVLLLPAPTAGAGDDAAGLAALEALLQVD